MVLQVNDCPAPARKVRHLRQVVLVILFFRSVAVALKNLDLAGWVRVLVGEILCSVVGRHETCMVLDAGLIPAIRTNGTII